MLMYSGCSSWPVAWVVRDADRLLDFASEFLLLSLLGLRERPLADLVLFLEALGSVGRSAEENRVKWVQVHGAGAEPALQLQAGADAETGAVGATDKSKPRKWQTRKTMIYCVSVVCNSFSCFFDCACMKVEEVYLVNKSWRCFGSNISAH